DLNIGGSKFELIPVRGGETHDAMLIYLPDERVMFMGDVIMPYLGAPFDEEGDLQGLLDAIAVIVSRDPQHLLHGHEPLTRNFTLTIWPSPRRKLAEPRTVLPQTGSMRWQRI